jgi:hypothetical protein
LVRTIKAPTLLLVPRLDLYNPVDDAIEAATLVPSVTLVRLDGQEPVTRLLPTPRRNSTTLGARSANS